MYNMNMNKHFWQNSSLRFVKFYSPGISGCDRNRGVCDADEQNSESQVIRANLNYFFHDSMTGLSIYLVKYQIVEKKCTCVPLETQFSILREKAVSP